MGYDNMDGDLNGAKKEELKVIDATKTTEDLQKQINTSDDEGDGLNELAELMGEPTSTDPAAKREELIEQFVAQFELGHVVKLKSPIEVGLPNGQIKRISEVAFSVEPEARHIQKLPMQMDTWTFAHQLSLIGSCTGLTAAELLKIKTCDLMSLMEVAVSFFSVGPKIGDL